MERDEYALMHRAEDRMWWYRGAHANLLDAGAPIAARPGARILDAGCGTGGFLARYRRAFPAGQGFGIDYEALACALAREKSGAVIGCASVNELPFDNGAFDAVFSVDVLCHRAVDEGRALAEMRRCLQPQGLLVINLPAYEWMKSAHDARVHNARRYTPAGLDALLRRHGFTPLSIRFWNSLLFPLMVLRRKTAGSGAESDVQNFPPLLNALFGSALSLERALLRTGVRFPFGGSVLAVASPSESPSQEAGRATL